MAEKSKSADYAYKSIKIRWWINNSEWKPAKALWLEHEDIELQW